MNISINTPVVVGSVDRSENKKPSFKFFCEFCKVEHVHSFPEEAGGTRYRHAHCFNESSPFKKTGYLMVTHEEYDGLAEIILSFGKNKESPRYSSFCDHFWKPFVTFTEHHGVDRLDSFTEVETVYCQKCLEKRDM